MSNGRASGKQWTRAHELERLAQLRADVDSALERLWTLYLFKSTQVSKADQAEWLRRVEQVEELRTWAIKDLEQIIGECHQDGR